MRRLFLSIPFLLSLCFGAERPNILWISAEDIGPHLGCYGDPHAITPHLDQLASRGVRYRHAFTAAGVCAPCRSTIITGMYQNSIGTHHMRCDATLPDWLTPFPLLLRASGYYCTNNQKTDYQFSEPSAREIWDENSAKAHWSHRPADRPFFAVFNFTGCHESGIAREAKHRKVTSVLTPEQRQDPAAFTNLPPYYPDNAVVREAWRRYYENITALDHFVGERIAELVSAGEWDNTIVFFWSDHGAGLPRAKRWLYDSGTRIPLIVSIPEAFRSPGQGEPGTVSDELIVSNDFGCTVLNLAGVTVPDYVQGRAFLGPGLSPPREAVFGARDRMDERYDIIRTVRTHRFRYIRNFEPLKPYYQFMNTPEQGATMREIRRAEKSGELTPAMALFSGTSKPTEELYDTAADPHEINNLAEDPEYAPILAEMRERLAEWQFSIGDIGLLPESEIERLETGAGSAWAILRQEGRGEEFIARLVEMATRASEGPLAIPDLRKALDDVDPAIRYWGAVGLGNFAAEARGTAGVVPRLTELLADRSAAVRIAAGRALCRMGETDRALSLLAAELEGSGPWARLEAAIVLDELDEMARPVIAALKAARSDQPNKYIVRVANRAVNELEGTDHEVP